jgi:hypothetical protein
MISTKFKESMQWEQGHQFHERVVINMKSMQEDGSEEEEIRSEPRGEVSPEKRERFYRRLACSKRIPLQFTGRGRSRNTFKEPQVAD